MLDQVFSYNNFEILEQRVIVTPFTDHVAELLAVLKVGKGITDGIVSGFSRLTFTVIDERYSFRLFASDVAIPAKMMTLFVARKRDDKTPVQACTGANFAMRRKRKVAASLLAGNPVPSLGKGLA